MDTTTKTKTSTRTKIIIGMAIGAGIVAAAGWAMTIGPLRIDGPDWSKTTSPTINAGIDGPDWNSGTSPRDNY